MLKPTIIDDVTLPNGEVGKCGYLNLTEDKQMTILYNTKEGNDYTLSFFVKADSNKVFELFQGNEPNDVKADVTTEWSKVKFTFKANGKQIGVYIPVGEYYLYQLKLEDGKVATSWTASPNDTTTQTQSMIEQSADSITSTVERVVLEQVGEDFVEKSKVISEINQSAEAVSINANKINLNGVVTANENFKILEDGTMKCKDAEIIGGTFNVQTDSSGEDVIDIMYKSGDTVERHNTLRPSVHIVSSKSGTDIYKYSSNGQTLLLDHYTTSDNPELHTSINSTTISPSTIDLYKKQDNREKKTIEINGENGTINTDGKIFGKEIESSNVGLKVKSADGSRNDVAIWSDSEGGNIEIHAGNGHTNSWQADAHDGNFRLYTFRESDGAYNGISINEDSTITANDFVSSTGTTLDTVRKFLPINATQGTGWWIADALHIDTQNAYGDANRYGYCHTSSVNIPSDFNFGIREVVWYNSNLIFVKLFGYTNQGKIREWYRVWNGSTWGSWFSTLLTSGYADTASWMNIDSITKLRGQGYIVASTESEGNYIWSVNAWSDSKLKKNIKDTKVKGLDLISKIQHKEYDWKYDDLGDSVKLGYVANELKDVIPEAVISVPQDNFHGYDELYQIDMVKMIPYMTKSIQELKAEVDSLKKEIKELKGGKK